MEPVDLNTVIGVAIGYLVATAIRYLSRTRFWSRVRSRAQQALSDPNVPIDDPQTAAEHALVEEQRPRIDEVARKLSPSEPPPLK